MREASRGFTVKFVQIYFDTVIKAGRTTAAGLFCARSGIRFFSSGHSGRSCPCFFCSLFRLVCPVIRDGGTLFRLPVLFLCFRGFCSRPTAR